jgi:dihydroneopterin aldolase
MVFSLPTRHAKLEIERTAHNVIVVDPERDYVHVMSGRAATVLEACDGTRTCDQIARIVSEQTRAPYESVAQEVAHLVASFADLALIEAGSPHP